MSSTYHSNNLLMTKDKKLRQRALYTKELVKIFSWSLSIVFPQLPLFAQPHIKAGRLCHVFVFQFLMKALMSSKACI